MPSQSTPTPIASGVQSPPIVEFFDDWPRDQSALLFLDYDGTLAPFVADRDRAHPYPGVRERIGRIVRAGHTRVIVVSGRAVQTVVRLLQLDEPVEIWGNHGVQRLRPDGRVDTVELSDEIGDALRHAATAIDAGEQLEVKPASVAVHTRGTSSEASRVLLEETRRAWRPIVERIEGMELHRFDGGLELRSSEVDKGFAVRSILEEVSDAMPLAYLGDDLTDEDAFAALGTRGLKILVRPEVRSSAADVWLRPPEELLQFLDQWSEHAHPVQTQGNVR